MKAVLLISCIILFLVIIFLDQNSAPVPMKVIVGQPFGIRLSLIILGSMAIGMLIAAAGFIAIRLRIRKK